MSNIFSEYNKDSFDIRNVVTKKLPRNPQQTDLSQAITPLVNKSDADIPNYDGGSRRRKRHSRRRRVANKKSRKNRRSHKSRKSRKSRRHHRCR